MDYMHSNLLPRFGYSIKDILNDAMTLNILHTIYRSFIPASNNFSLLYIYPSCWGNIFRSIPGMFIVTFSQVNHPSVHNHQFG